MSFSPGQHPAEESQMERLKERARAEPFTKKACGVEFVIQRGVYGTSVDTELMADSVKIDRDETFFEVGCGSGAISLLVAPRARSGIATDINPLAITNAEENARRLGITNVEFRLGDCFADIRERFNVLLCNPPYQNHPVEDPMQRMFWDPDDVVKQQFLAGAAERLLPQGRIYFGWANFQDIDIDLPMRLAAEHSLVLQNITERASHSKLHMFYVLEFAVRT